MTSKMSVVSIVIPTYNQAHFLEEALAGLISQTYPHWEAVVVNNDSTDDTVAVVERFNDPRITLINFKNHGVIASSRNLAIQRSNAEFIAFLDSDDLWYPDKLKVCVHRLQQGFDMVCHGQDHFQDGSPTKTPYRYGPYEKTKYSALLLEGNCLATSAIVVRRSLLTACGNFSANPAYATAEDYDLWLKLARAQAKISLIDDILGAYRFHGANTSSSRVRLAKATLAVLKAHTLELRGFEWLLRIRLALKMFRISFFVFRRQLKG